MAFTKLEKTEWGTIGVDESRGGRLYLRFAYKGKEFARSLGCTAISVARKKASRIRKEAEDAHDQSLVTEGEIRPQGIRIFDEIYRKMVSPEKLAEGEDPGYNGFLEAFYPLETTNLNTHYDNEKLLKLYFGKLAFILGKKFEDLTVGDLKKEWMIAAYSEIKKTYSKKVQQKVTVCLTKFIFWEIKSNRIPTDLNIMDEIKNKTPSNAEVIKLRQRELENEIWTDEEIGAVLSACKSRHPCTRELDYEILYIMRYMGLPPSDIYQLTHDDFRMGKQGLELFKERAKEAIAEYAQPIDKNDKEHDAEVLRIIQERLKATKKGERLFFQPMTVKRYRSDKQDDQTRWVSNFSGRRICLQKSLGLPQKGAKGLRATFITFWIEDGAPEAAIATWVGHAPGSAMIRKFYSQTKTSSYWKRPG